MLKRFRRSVPCFLLAAALAAWSPAVLRADSAAPFKTLEAGTLKVCLYSGFAPFSSLVDGQWQGWEVDYLKEFAQQSKLTFEVVSKDFEGIWLQPGHGDCDIAATGISDTQDRRKAAGPEADWSNTYYHVVRTFLVRTADFTKLTQVEDLKGKKAIITKDSTANSDLCYRMKGKGIHPCQKADGDHPCASFKGLEKFEERTRERDPSCVFIEYPWMADEKNAAADVAQSLDRDKHPGPPFTYGGGYGSVQSLVCSQGGQALATVWPHCNLTSDGKAYAEPFSFVARHADTGLVHALNCYINSHPYPGTPTPDLSCPAPPWTPPADKACSK
jgi:Bacterial extracellular solute-binding proteins, family 3